MRDHRELDHDPDAVGLEHRGHPGKRSLSEALPSRGPVQRRAAGTEPPAGEPARGGAADDPCWFATGSVQAVAAAGVAGASAPLPHLEAVQRSFGRHDLGDVRAQVGGDAAGAASSIGATAYATGDRIGFAAAPDLHTAAHEAAHVVQQRAGVHLKGGVGEVGDPYERHADEVADLVVAGRSAEHLLDAHAGGGGGRGVQRKLRVDTIDGGQPFEDDGLDFVPATWARTPAEKGIFKRWLRDDEQHRYPTKDALRDAIRRVAIQPFGTDIAEAYKTADEQRTIFRQALEAGYRVFDTSYTYETLEHLWAAVRALGIPRDELTIVYKVKPADDAALDTELDSLSHEEDNPLTRGTIREARKGKVSTRLDAATAAMDGATPDVLMLHDLDADLEVLETNVQQLAVKVRAGQAKAIGLSNAAVFHLDHLGPIATAAGAPIKYVQNRCSPYFRDDEVRAACAARGITYQAYGMMGSAQAGACAGVGDEGEGMPTQYLLARHDPRVKALAQARGISEGELLLGWAQQRGIAPVTFTSRPDQAKQNFDRAAQPLPPDLARALDELFVAPSAARAGAVGDMADTPLKQLYTAYPDPTAWSILDTLRAADGGEALLTRIAGEVVTAHGLGQRPTALKNLSLNLVRHVADIQSAIQRMQNHRASVIKDNRVLARDGGVQAPVPEVLFADWRDVLLPAFRDLAAAAAAPYVFEALCAWAGRNHLAGHTAGHALEAWPELALTPDPVAVVEELPPILAQQAIVAGPVTVGYADDQLYDESFMRFKAGEAAALAADATVYYAGAEHVVVSNQPDAQTLTLRPA